MTIARKRRWLALSTVALVASPALADNWDNSSNDFQWSTATNWADNTEPTASDTAVFPAAYPGGHGNILLSAGEVASSLTLNNSYSLSGGTLTIGGTGSVTVAASQFGAIHSILSGATGLTKAGTGILTLYGANTFTGNVLVDAGDLQVYNDNNLGDAANNVTIAGGDFTVWNDITTARTFTMGTGGGEFSVTNDATLALTSGLGAGSTALTKSSFGILSLAAASTRTGSVTISEGTIRISNATALGTGATAISVAGAGARLWIDGATLNRAVSLSGSFSVLTGTGAARSNGVITVPNATSVQVAAEAATDVLTIGDAANDITGGNASSQITAHGNGTIVLGFASNYAGGWQIQLPTVRISNASALGTGTSAISMVAGELELAGVSLNRAITFSNAASNPVTLRGTGSASSVGVMTVGAGKGVTLATGTSTTDVLTIGNAHNDYTGGSGATTTVTGAGAVGLNFNNDYQGSWIVNGGRLSVGSIGSLGSVSNPVTLNSGATLEIAGAAIDNPLQMNDGSTVRGIGTVSTSIGTHTIASGASVTFAASPLATDVFTLGNGANDLTGGSAGSSIHVTGATGSGIIALNVASNNYTGSWVIEDSAHLRISTDASLGSADNAVNMTDFSVLEVLSSVTTSRPFNLDNGVLAVRDNVVFTLNSPLGETAGQAAFGSLSIVNLGTFVFNVPTARTGTTYINWGTVLVPTTRALTSGFLKLGPADVRITPNGTNAGAGRLAALEMLVSRIDLADNRLAIGNDIVSPIGSWNGTAYTGLTGLVAQGRNDGAWNAAQGITTSMSDATGGSGYTSIGVARASQVLSILPSDTAIWSGLTISGSDTLVMYTYGGDANLSGYVDIDDYGLIDFNASTGGVLTGWFNGDFNYDGVQDIDDYGIIDFVINIQGPPFSTASMTLTSVPEPSTCCGIAVFVSAIASRRRRR